MKIKINPMIRAAFACALLVSSSNSAISASTVSPPSNLPLSLRALEAYAWEQTASIRASAWSSGQINSAGDSNSVWMIYSKTNGMVNQRDVLQVIASVRLRISVLHSNDTVSFQANILDKDGYELFYGGSGSQLAPASGTVSSNILPVRMSMTDTVWITVTNVSNVYIVERDANGNVTRYYYPSVSSLGNNVIKFAMPGYFGDKYGEAILTMIDGTQVAYSLHDNGRKIVPKSADVSASSVTAPGNYYFEGTNQVWVAVPQDEYDGKMSPLVQYNNTNSTSVFVFFGSDLPTGESHTSIRIWKQGTDPAKADLVPLYQGSAWSLKQVGPGYWWIQFVYPSGFGIDSNQYYPPYDGGNIGKGAVAAPVSSSVGL